jgi:hypothetical protein
VFHGIAFGVVGKKVSVELFKILFKLSDVRVMIGVITLFANKFKEVNG